MAFRFRPLPRGLCQLLLRLRGLEWLAFVGTDGTEASSLLSNTAQCCIRKPDPTANNLDYWFGTPEFSHADHHYAVMRGLWLPQQSQLAPVM